MRPSPSSRLRRFSRALREKCAWCLKRQTCPYPKLLASYVVFFAILYVTYVTLWLDNSVSRVGAKEAQRTLPPDKEVFALHGSRRPAAKNVRQLMPLKIPRHYSKPVASFVPLLTRFDGQEQTLSQPFSVLRNETLLKSVSGVERKRKPVPQFPPQFKENSPYKVSHGFLKSCLC